MRPIWVWRNFFKEQSEQTDQDYLMTRSLPQHLFRSVWQFSPGLNTCLSCWASKSGASKWGENAPRSVLHSFWGISIIPATPQMCNATMRRHMQQEQRNVVYHPRTDDSYRPPSRWQKTLKQQRGLIFTNSMQCTVNKRAERAEEETAESAVDSERRWPFRRAGWNVRAPSEYRGTELNETFIFEEMQRMLTFKYTFIFHRRVVLMQHCRLFEKKTLGMGCKANVFHR